MNSILGVIILLACAGLLLQSCICFVRELLCREIITADVMVKDEDKEKNCLVPATATFQCDGVQYEVTIARVQPLTTKIMLQICKKHPKIFKVLGDYQDIYIMVRNALIAAFAVIIIQYFW